MCRFLLLMCQTMFHPEIFKVKNAVLLVMVLLLALSASGSFASMGPPTVDLSMSAHQSMDAESMDWVLGDSADCLSAGACSMDSCGQPGLTGSPAAKLQPCCQLHPLFTSHKTSPSLSAIYRPPRLPA